MAAATAPRNRPAAGPMPGASRRKADLVLHNARVLTLDHAKPRATLVAVRDGRVFWVGDDDDLEMVRGRGTRLLDCQGRTTVPGFVDAHLHLFSYAANLLAVDCSSRAVSSITDIQQALRSRASQTPPGGWIRGWGYEEFYLAEGRPPNRWDLDAAAPSHPVKLVHRSGHASVLNSMGLERLGITRETPEPAGAVIDRALDTAEPTGNLLEMEAELEARGAPTMTEADLVEGLALARNRLLSFGVTSIDEATPTRALAHWDMLHGLKRRALFPVRVRKMFSVADLEELRRRELFSGAGDHGLSVGAVKIMINETGRTPLPPREELREQVLRIHRCGYQAAFHAVEEAGIAAAIDALSYARLCSPPDKRNIAGRRHRIEHCGLCPPELTMELASLGLTVVTQPAFIREHGERYQAQVPPHKQQWLYPVASLMAAGVRVAFGSDCPVVPPDPMVGLCGAVTRSTRQGETIAPQEAVPMPDALEMYTSAAASASWGERVTGSIAPGRMADLVLLSGDPMAIEPERLEEVVADCTIIGGEILWERS